MPCWRHYPVVLTPVTAAASWSFDWHSGRNSSQGLLSSSALVLPQHKHHSALQKGSERKISPYLFLSLPHPSSLPWFSQKLQALRMSLMCDDFKLKCTCVDSCKCKLTSHFVHSRLCMKAYFGQPFVTMVGIKWENFDYRNVFTH